MSMNNVSLIGRLTKDIEVKKTTSGKSVASFTLAVGRKIQKEVDYIDCVAWNSSADYLCNYGKKGDLISVVGALQKRDQLYYRLSGMSAKPIENNGVSLDQEAKEMARLQKYEQIDNINFEIKILEMMIEYVDSYLEQMNKGIRVIAIEVYCNGKSLESFADSVGYTASGLARQINREIQRVMQKK